MIFSRRAFWAIALGCTSWVSAAEVPVDPSTSPPLAFEWRQETNPVLKTSCKKKSKNKHR